LKLAEKNKLGTSALSVEAAVQDLAAMQAMVNDQRPQLQAKLDASKKKMKEASDSIKVRPSRGPF
jgi:hypothetical protein